MKYIFFVIDNNIHSASETEMNAIDAFNEKLQTDGNWIYACGITSPSNAWIIDYRETSKFLTQDSLNDWNDFYSGFWIIEAHNLDQAKELAQEASHACNRKVEVRAEL